MFLNDLYWAYSYFYISILLYLYSSWISRSNMSWFFPLFRFPLSPQSEVIQYIAPGRSETCLAFKHWRNSYSDWNQNVTPVAIPNTRIQSCSCSTLKLLFPDLLMSSEDSLRVYYLCLYFVSFLFLLWTSPPWSLFARWRPNMLNNSLLSSYRISPPFQVSSPRPDAWML